MASLHRKFLSSTLTIIVTEPPCLLNSCFKFCSCDLPSPPPPPTPHENRLVPTGMTITACVIGVFFVLGIVCIVAGTKYLKWVKSNRRDQPVLDDFADEDHGPVVDHPFWLINFVGLQQSVIDSIAIFKYRRGEGLIEGTECSVCLGEFEEDEDLRLLPKCSHAFHLPCIDTWLRSHKNCPLCRAPVASAIAVVGSEPAGIEAQLEGSGDDLDHQQVGEDGAGIEIDVTGDVVGFGSATPNIVRNGLLDGKSCDSRALSDLAQDRKMGFEGEVQPMRRSVSMNVSSASVGEMETSSFQDPSELVGSSNSSRSTSL